MIRYKQMKKSYVTWNMALFPGEIVKVFPVSDTAYEVRKYNRSDYVIIPSELLQDCTQRRREMFVEDGSLFPKTLDK